MKCSEYLWKYVALRAGQGAAEGWSPERVQGELREQCKAAGDAVIHSDATGEEMTEREALSVLGRNEAQLRLAYERGQRDQFDALVEAQLVDDGEAHG